MTRQQDFLAQACAHFGLDVTLNFELLLPSDRRIIAEAYIPTLGGERGLLIFSSADQLANAESEIIGAGFGYTIYLEPGLNEHFDLQNYRDTLIDWGYVPGER